MPQNKPGKPALRPSRQLAAGGIVTRTDPQTGRMETLLVRTRGRGGYWGFPKGHVLPGEANLDAALREIREETGLQMVVKDLHQTWQTNYRPAPDTDKTVTYFWFEPASPQSPVRVQEEEISDYAWIDFMTADLYLTYDQDRAAYRSFLVFVRARAAA